MKVFFYSKQKRRKFDYRWIQKSSCSNITNKEEEEEEEEEEGVDNFSSLRNDKYSSHIVRN